jgi:hypothetical protein
MASGSVVVVTSNDGTFTESVSATDAVDGDGVVLSDTCTVNL